MPSGTTTSAIQLLERGALPNFRDAYDRQVNRVAALLSDVMELNLPSSKAIEIVPYMLAQPHARVWRDGEAAFEGAARSRSFTIVNRAWEVRVPWTEAQEQFDQIGYLVPSIRNAGESLGLIPERVFFQLLQGTTDAALLPAVPNAADGAALYSTTDGAGANRFGVANGNLLGGSGVATTQQVVTDFHRALAQIEQFQDGQGQPLWLREQLETGGYVVVHGAANRQVFAQAFAQHTQQGAAAGVSNVIRDANVRFRLWPTQRITNDDWYVFAAGATKKAFVQTTWSPIRQILASRENSDWARDYRAKYLQWDAGMGFGIGEAYQTVKIDN